jgi:hypothetical protein
MQQITKYERNFANLFGFQPRCGKSELSVFAILRVSLYETLCTCLRESATTTKRNNRKCTWFEQRLARTLVSLDRWMHDIYHSPGFRGTAKWMQYLQLQLCERLAEVFARFREWRELQCHLGENTPHKCKLSSRVILRRKRNLLP